MDKQQKIAIILLPLIAIALLAGVTAMTGADEIVGGYTDGTYTGVGQGFGGDIKVTVEVSGGNIATIAIDEHSETPGLGDTAAEQVAQQIIATQGFDVEIVTGATVSSNGLVEAVQNALEGAGGASYPDGTHEGIASGFGGDMKVTVEVSGGRIVSISLDEHSETPGLGDTAAEEVAQQIIATQSLDVEVVTGATMSSVAMMEAVGNAVAGGEYEAEDEAEETVAIPEDAVFVDGVYEVTVDGFMGDVKVQVEIVDGEIASIKVLEQDETPGLGDAALEEVAAAIVAENSLAVNTVSGATVSSKAMIAAVEAALIEAIAEEGAGSAAAQLEGLTDGTFEGTAEGFMGEIKVQVEVADGKVASVEVLDHSETPGLGDTAMNEVIEVVVAQQSLDVDAVSGATASSKAVLEAIQNALN